MKVGDDEQHDKFVHLWFKEKRMEGCTFFGPNIVWKSCPAAQEDVWRRVKFLWKYRIAMEVLQDRGMENSTCPLKVRKYLSIERQVQLSSHLSVDLLKINSLVSIKYSIVMRLDSTFACCQTRH